MAYQRRPTSDMHAIYEDIKGRVIPDFLRFVAGSGANRDIAVAAFDACSETADRVRIPLTGVRRTTPAMQDKLNEAMGPGVRAELVSEAMEGSRGPTYLIEVFHAPAHLTPPSGTVRYYPGAAPPGSDGRLEAGGGTSYKVPVGCIVVLLLLTLYSWLYITTEQWLALVHRGQQQFRRSL